MNPVRCASRSPSTAGVFSTPEELKELWIAADRYLDSTRIVSILSDVIAKGEKILAIKENLAAVERVAAANPENDSERIQETWRYDWPWCRWMGLDWYDDQTRKLFLDTICDLKNNQLDNKEKGFYPKLSEKVQDEIDYERSILVHLRCIFSEISTNFHDEPPGHLITASCQVTRGPNAASASLSLVAA